MTLPLRQLESNLRWLTRYRTIQLSYVFAPYYVLYIMSLGATPSDVLVLTLITAVASGATEVVTGYFADRRGRKLSLVLGGLFSAAGFTFYSVATDYGWLVITAAVLVGLGASFSYGPDTSLAYDSCYAASEGELYDRFEHDSQSYGALAEAASGIVGLALVGFCGLLGAQDLGLRLMMILQVGMHLLTLRLIRPIREPYRHHRQFDPEHGFWRTLIGLRRRPHLLSLFLVAANISAITAVVAWLTPAYYQAVNLGGHHLPDWAFGLLWSAYLASIWVFKRYAMPFRRLFGRYGSLAALLVIALACYLGLSLVWPGGLLVFFGLYFVRTVQVPQMNRYASEEAGDHERTMILSIQRLGQRLYYGLIAALSAYWLSHTGSLTAGIVVIGAVCGIVGLIATTLYLASRQYMQRLDPHTV